MALTPPFDRVVFDCDSALSRLEGIEELAASDAAKKPAIEDLTRQAMSGSLPLEQVYARRLEILQPRQTDVRRVGSRYIETAQPAARELVAALHGLDKEVHIISGGLRLAGVAFGGWLGIRDERVHAVQIHFDHHGRYYDFDRASPLARNDGKREVLEGLPPARTVFIGDGITDAEAKSAVDGFVCYGGVVLRPEVSALADAVVTEPSLASLLGVLCSRDELEKLRRDPRHRHLVTEAALS